MSGRALLNVVEAQLLDGLDGEGRTQMLWSLHDPAGFLAAQNDSKKTLLATAGGEIG